MSKTDSKAAAGEWRFCTYLHRRCDTGQVFYIGKGTKLRANTKGCRSTLWQRIEKKHGRTVEILSFWKTEAEAFEHERFLIGVFRDLGHPLVNMTDGGEGASGVKISPETQARRTAALALAFSNPAAVERRLAAMRVAKATPEHRELTSKRMRRERGSAEARAKQSVCTKLSWSCPESRERRLAAMKAAAAKPEARARLAELARQRVKSPESLARSIQHMMALNAKNAKPVICITTGAEYASCAAAAAALRIHKQGIRDVCLGRCKTTKVLEFRFKAAGMAVKADGEKS